MHVRRDGVRVQSGREQVRPRLEACQPLAETFGVHEDLLVWRTRGVLRARGGAGFGLGLLLIVILLWGKV